MTRPIRLVVRGRNTMTDSDADASIYPFPDEKPDTLPLFCKWLFFIPKAASGTSGDFAASLDQLTDALETEIGWIREHTRLGALAQRWLAQRRGSDLLLRGAELSAAEQWITSRPTTAPDPSDAHRSFLAARAVST